jgi:hypothetical protein
MNECAEDAIKNLEALVTKLYDHIYIGEPSNDTPYFYYGYSLDDEGYFRWYLEILRALYRIPSIENRWSEKSLRDRVGNLIVELGKQKERFHSTDEYLPDLSYLVTNWFTEFQVEFDEREYYAPVVGLVTETPFTIGNVSFWPLKEKLQEIEKFNSFRKFSYLSEHRDCLASARIRAESNKGAEILRAQIEEALNILRYIGALIWYNQPAKHIYLKEKELNRISFVLSVADKGTGLWIGDSLYSPVPFIVNDEFLSAAEGYGLRDLSSWLSNSKATPLQQVLLLAIQWFGDATQELRSLQAFMKYYIAIEILLKKEKEGAYNVVPQRVAFLLEGTGSARDNEIKSLIKERNAVFHGGSTLHDTPEVLDWVTHQVARNIINHLIQEARLAHFYPDDYPKKWETKKDMLAWVESEIKKNQAE